MAGYSQLNQGYAEQPGVNWGKVAAYGGMGIVGAGVGRMAYNKTYNSMTGARARGALKTGAGWGAKQARMAGRAAKHVWGGIHKLDANERYMRMGTDMVKNWHENTKYQQALARTSSDPAAKGYLRRSEAFGWMVPSGAGADHLAGPLKGSLWDKSKQMMKGDAYSTLGYFSGHGYTGMKRAGVIGGRLGLAGASLAIINALNPFSD